MSHKPITITPELAAKYDHAGQPERFEHLLKTMVAMPPEKAQPPTEKRPRGRPKKSS